MRFIDRKKVPSPESLGRYDYRHHCWDDEPGKIRFGGDDKNALLEALRRLQDGFCAYCEGEPGGDCHIEHFRRKASWAHPELMFAWDNLFLSCNSADHCGHYKDNGKQHYDPQDLIKPDEDDPWEFLYFNRHGDVLVRTGLDPSEERRAHATIRVFHLNCPALRNARRMAVKVFLGSEPSLFEDLYAFDDDDRDQYIDALLEEAVSKPHFTAVRHLFEGIR